MKTLRNLSWSDFVKEVAQGKEIKEILYTSESQLKIISADIVMVPRMASGNKAMQVVLEDQSVHIAFSYYDDEIQFSTQEMVGLTVPQAQELRHQRDVAYLRS